MTGSRKRRRMSAPSTRLPDKHEVFTEWSRHRGVQIRSVRPATLPGRGVGLMATATIHEGEQIMFVPGKVMFKPNATLSNTTAKNGHGLTASPQASLALSVMAECLKPESPYHAWQSTWPTERDFESSMPLFWKDELRARLPPPVQQPLERQLEDYQRDLSFALSTRGDLPDWTERRFRYYWAIVNSRSFHFKPAGSKPGFMVLCPFIDYMNHGPSGTTVNVRQTPKGYEVIADREYEAGEEILATYGAHPNDKLLVHYGFINETKPDEPSDDDVRLDHVILPHLSPKTREQLQDVGYLGSYALLPATNELCFKTEVAIRAELLTSNEWEYFMSTGEDMTQDRSKDVLQWLKPLMDGYRKKSAQELDALAVIDYDTASPEASAMSLIIARWKQILQALEVFLQTS